MTFASSSERRLAWTQMGLPTFEQRLVMQFLRGIITMEEFEDYLMECHRDGTIDQPCLYVGDEFPIG